MKKTTMKFLALVFVVLFASIVFAEDKKVNNPVKQDREPWFNPSLSVGYAYLGDPNIKFRTKQTTLGGVGEIETKAWGVDGIYVAGELPFALTDRLKLTLGGRWTFSASDDRTKVLYNNNAGLIRNFDSDDRYWTTADLLLSYAFIKNLSFLKDVSAVVGFRWDHQKMSFEDPTSVGVANSPLDKITLKLSTYSPVLGLTSTFKGFKSGIFGGDVKLGISGSPFLWGNVDYRETFTTAVGFDFDHNLHRGYFVTPKGEMDLLSVRITPGFEAKLSATAEYTWFRVRKTGTMEFWGTGLGAPNQSDFEFKIRPKLATVGIKASAAF